MVFVAHMQPFNYAFLIRDFNDDYGEKKAMTALGIPFIEYRSLIDELEQRTTIIGRYSVLPFYKELEIDVLNVNNCELINSYEQFKYCADLQNWYQDLSDLTPPRRGSPFRNT